MDTSNFDCVICQDKLNDAHETLCCHQCYCKQCITEWMGRNKTCPSCRKAVTKKDIAQNVPMQRLVDNLPAKCPNYDSGCHAKLTRGSIDDHISISCKYALVSCQYCHAMIERYYTERHLTAKCPKRVVPCKYCRLNFKAEDLRAHKDTTCLKVPIYCTYCDDRITRETRNEHHQNICRRIPITCPFSKLGCTFQGRRKYYLNHLVTKAHQHVAQAEQFFTQQNAQKAAMVAAKARYFPEVVPTVTKLAPVKPSVGVTVIKASASRVKTGPVVKPSRVAKAIPAVVIKTTAPVLTEKRRISTRSSSRREK